MKKQATLFFVLAAAAIAGSATVSLADTGELDHGAIPQGLVVRDDGQGNRAVFKADGAQANVRTDGEAAAALADFVKPANQIASIVQQSELDHTSSSEAWYYWYGYNNYYYGYYYYGYNYYYQPCYHWYYGGYYYNYYYRY